MLKDPKFSKNLHQNADSWRVFSDLCRRELERRALEEPDLMKASFLIILLLGFPHVVSEGRDTRSSSHGLCLASTQANYA
jgi:hypothetical protein